VLVEQAGKIWRITGIKSFKLDASVDGRPVSSFRMEGLESIYRLPVTTHARVFSVHWRREIYLAGMPCRIEFA